MIHVCLVMALVKAEKQRLKKSRIPSTPRNLSIHKDIGSEDQSQYKCTSAIPVVKGDGEEVLMGKSSLSNLDYCK